MKLLSDKPVTTSARGVDFSYTDFAESLAELISSAPRPFTIGMFGKWGTGKSTIIHSLGEKLDKRKYIYLKFDVWKYESDSLRRSFLIDIAEQLNETTPFYKSKIDINQLEDELYKSKSIPKEEFKPSVWALAAAAVLGGVIYLLTKQNNSTLTSAALGSIPIMLEVIRRVDPSMLIRKININRSPTGSPEEFERIFKETFLTRTKKTLVIVVDNLDRTQKEKTVELLSTVKTFLNADASEDNVVFLIACDDQAIKEHIRSLYSASSDDHAGNNHQSEFNSNEFLRKFFNVVVELPVLIENEVTGFTQKMLKDTELAEFNSTDLQQIINYAYQENPREIKQYVNNLAAYHLLLDSRSDGNGLSKEFIQKNLNFICKMLVLRDKYEREFNKIKELSISALPWSEIKKTVDTYSSDEEFKSFDEKTSWAEPTDEYISWFFRLRRSSEDIALPGWDQFVNFAGQQNTEEANKLFDSFENEEALNNQLIAYINRIRTEPARITPFFAVYTQLLVKASDELKEKLKGSINLIFESTPSGNDLGKIIGLINLDLLLHSLLPYVRPESLKKLVSSMQAMLDTASQTDGDIAEDHLINIIEALDQHTTELSKLTNAVRRTITNKHASLGVLETLEDRHELKKKLITPQIIHKYLESVDPKKDGSEISLLNWGVLEKHDLKDNGDFYIEKTQDLVQELQAEADIPKQQQLTNTILETMYYQETQPLQVQEAFIPQLVNICQTLNDWYAQFDEEGRASVVLLLSIFALIPGNTAASFAETRLTDFVKARGLDSVLEVIDNPVIDKTKAQSALRDRMATNNSEISTLLPHLESDHIPYVISHVTQKAIDTQDEAAFLEQMNIANHMYITVTEEASKQEINQQVMRVLENKATAFPSAAKTVTDRRRYKYITTEQQKAIRQLLEE
jgi:hypothetical protein